MNDKNDDTINEIWSIRLIKRLKIDIKRRMMSDVVCDMPFDEDLGETLLEIDIY